MLKSDTTESKGKDTAVEYIKKKSSYDSQMNITLKYIHTDCSEVGMLNKTVSHIDDSIIIQNAIQYPINDILDNSDIEETESDSGNETEPLEYSSLSQISKNDDLSLVTDELQAIVIGNQSSKELYAIISTDNFIVYLLIYYLFINIIAYLLCLIESRH